MNLKVKVNRRGRGGGEGMLERAPPGNSAGPGTAATAMLDDGEHAPLGGRVWSPDRMLTGISKTVSTKIRSESYGLNHLCDSQHTDWRHRFNSEKIVFSMLKCSDWRQFGYPTTT